MSRHTKKKDLPKKKDLIDLSFLKRELTALLFLGLGAFVYLSLFSYNPFDLSFNSLAQVEDITNWGGVAGSYLADGLFFLFGAGAYFVGFFFLLVAIFFLSGWRNKLNKLDIPIYLVFVLFISVLFQLTKENLTFFDFTIQAGGLFGSLFAQWGESFVGRPGTYLLVIIGALLTFVWATKVSVNQIGFAVGGFCRQVALSSSRFAVIYWHRSWKLMKKSVAQLQILRARRNQAPDAGIQADEEEVSVLISKHEINVEKIKQEAQQRQATARSEPKIFTRVDDGDDKNKAEQLELGPLNQEYQLPPLSFLDSDKHHRVVIDEEQLKFNARLLEKKLLDFSVEGRVTEIHPGPVVTMYEFQPAPGVKLSRIANLMDDLSLAMGGRSVRIVAPLPNKPAVGIEIPNTEREMVLLKDIIGDASFQDIDSPIPFALGKNIEGIPTVADLSKMPHLLIAGATGAGKSVAINAMILSLLYKSPPEQVRLIMVDPKMLELSLYEGIPHLLLPVVTQPKKAALALQWAVREMERRYRLLSDVNARGILNYNEKMVSGEFESKLVLRQKKRGGIAPEDDIDIKHDQPLPFIVIIIDELADLMMVSSREVEEAIARLAQMARAAGIHLILATQRPSVDVLTGVIKANFPARISFKVASKHDARTVLDTIGSERLLGAGDMLFIPPGTSKMIRVHGAYVSEVEVIRVVEFLKKQARPVYDESILKPLETEATENAEEELSDELYDNAIAIVAETRSVSISMIQRRLRVGYNRAARMVEKMETDGIVSPPSGAGHRQVLVSASPLSS